MSMNSELKGLGCSPEVVKQLVAANRALQRIKGSRLWEDWLEIGFAIEVAHADMMKRLGLETENGAPHNEPWGKILKASGFDAIGKEDRHALRECLKNFDAITIWRDAMDEVARSRHNHPRRVLEHWRKSQQQKDDPFADLDEDLGSEGEADGGAFDPRLGKRGKRRGGRGDQRLIELEFQLDAAYRQLEDKQKIITMLEARIVELELRLAQFVGNPSAVASAPPLPH